MIPAPSAEIWLQARKSKGLKPVTGRADNRYLLNGCPCGVCKRVREIVRERYTLDKPSRQFAVTLALAETWKLKQHFRADKSTAHDPNNGKYNVTSCTICNFVVSRTVARKLGWPLPSWKGR